MAEKFSGRDMGIVTEANREITWVSFLGISLEKVEYAIDATEDEKLLATSIPVSTKELIDAGISFAPDEDGNVFVWADIDDIGAADKGDVQASNFGPVAELTEEDKAAWEGRI